ncbi:MAG: serine--tRNA ligase [Phycisphaeraceae bacterium]|nr:serine--tRNA ligase [Phycisphaeraceae bacterium]MBX3367156.1 serine--tRNA ligase [Phycisphaeraceae bacterium]
MIDLKQLRENPAHYALGAKAKNVLIDIERIVELDARKRALQSEFEKLRAEQNRLAKEIGPQIGKLKGSLKGKHGAEADAIQKEIDALSAKPVALKSASHAIEAEITALDPELQSLLLQVPLPPDPDVPVGKGSEDNIELRRWSPPGFDLSKSFEANRGFKPLTHLQLIEKHNLVSFERGVKLAGTRSYILTGAGMLLHNAILRYAFDTMVHSHGFTPMSVPVLVREEAMIGTGFFPAGREQAYLVDEKNRGGSSDSYLTGTGEVGLMGLHMDEILDEASLPLRYVTVSTCFRREAGAAGKDTAGLYRIHQFDKVEQVVICRADEAESRQWHKKMIGYVEQLLQSLGLPYRLLQCCTGDLGVKNADMVDIESWMPGRGDASDGTPSGEFGETHSASRLYDFQCRRLNMRYRPGGSAGKGDTVVCHSLNNTVAASPRILIPLLEMYQNADGSITIPDVLRPYMNGMARIG